MILPALYRQKVKLHRCLILLPVRRTCLMFFWFCAFCEKFCVSSHIQAISCILTVVLDLFYLCTVLSAVVITSSIATFNWF